MPADGGTTRWHADGGADVAFEAIGRVATMAQLPDLIRPGARAVFVGLPPEGQKVEIDALLLAYDGEDHHRLELRRARAGT